MIQSPISPASGKIVPLGQKPLLPTSINQSTLCSTGRWQHQQLHSGWTRRLTCGTRRVDFESLASASSEIVKMAQ